MNTPIIVIPEVDNGLTVKQREILERVALGDNRNLIEIGASCGVETSEVLRWLDDDNFKRIFQNTFRQLILLNLPKALTAVLEVMDSDYQNEKLKSALTIIRICGIDEPLRINLDVSDNGELRDLIMAASAKINSQTAEHGVLLDD